MYLKVYAATSITNYPVTGRHIQAVWILNVLEHIQDGPDGSWGTHGIEGTQVQVIKGILGN